jgi:hypothetical protein
MQFKDGKPAIVLKDETPGGVTCSRDSDPHRDCLVIRVPQFSYPANPQIPDHVYRLAL